MNRSKPEIDRAHGSRAPVNDQVVIEHTRRDAKSAKRPGDGHAGY